MVTVLATLLVVALVGFLVYVGVVLSKVKRTVKEHNSFSIEIENLHTRISSLGDEIYKKIDDDSQYVHNKIDNNINNLEISIDAVDRKIDSRFDKLMSEKKQ